MSCIDIPIIVNRIDVVLACSPRVLVDRGFELRLGQTKETNIGICFFSAKQAAISRKSKDWVGSEAG